jgi:ABC-type Zn2+ transport system substrate-binding protein/surface adhesin
MASNDEKNSVCSEVEELEIKDKEEKEEEEDEDEEEKEEDEEEEEEEEDDEDEDEEFDPSIIQYELLKNFLVDEEGNNVATHLGAIAHELRRLNKILSKKTN